MLSLETADQADATLAKLKAANTKEERLECMLKTILDEVAVLYERMCVGLVTSHSRMLTCIYACNNCYAGEKLVISTYCW